VLAFIGLSSFFSFLFTPNKKTTLLLLFSLL